MSDKVDFFSKIYKSVLLKISISKKHHLCYDIFNNTFLNTLFCFTERNTTKVFGKNGLTHSSLHLTRLPTECLKLICLSLLLINFIGILDENVKTE